MIYLPLGFFLFYSMTLTLKALTPFKIEILQPYARHCVGWLLPASVATSSATSSHPQ